MTVFSVHLVQWLSPRPGQMVWSARAGGMDRPSRTQSHPAGSLSSCQPSGPPCWASPLAFGLVGHTFVTIPSIPSIISPRLINPHRLYLSPLSVLNPCPSCCPCSPCNLTFPTIALSSLSISYYNYLFLSGLAFLFRTTSVLLAIQFPSQPSACLSLPATPFLF